MNFLVGQSKQCKSQIKSININRHPLDLQSAFTLCRVISFKHNLSIRPIYHQTEKRIEAHVFLSFIAYCLHVTLKNQAKRQASGLTPREIIEKFAIMQMVDVHLPTSDGRCLVMSRYTQPNPDHQRLLYQLGLKLPDQPRPRFQI